jgi:hypothetical protein
MSFYTTNADITGQNLCAGINDLVRSIYLSSQKEYSNQYLNINLILQSEKDFNLLITLMSDVATNQYNLFGQIKRDKVMEIYELHKNNLFLMELDKKIIGGYSAIEHNLKR